MKNNVSLVIIPLLAGLTACKSCDDGEVDPPEPVDAAVDAPPPPACDPLGPPGNQGCSPGQKCTWILTGVSTGELGCVADGTVSVGGACTRGSDGLTTGFDNCLAGLVCVEGTCADICGFDNSANAACTGGVSCARYDGLFANAGDEPTSGACLRSCNPITQKRGGDNLPCGTDKGCYLVTSETDTVAVCARAGTLAHDADVAGPAFANSCVPGAQPRRRDGLTDALQCGGLCNANDVTSAGGSEGGLEIAGLATAKDNCQTSWGAGPPGDGTTGESCRYWWAREPFVGLGPYSNTVGWCFKHAVFQFDSNDDGTDDMPFPRCPTLTNADVVPPISNPPQSDAQYFWCVALPATIAPVQAVNRQPAIARLGNWR